MPRGFDIPREQLDAGREAEEDRLKLMDLKPDAPIWVSFNSWAGRTRTRAVLVKVNPKRSKVRYLEEGTGDNYLGGPGSEHLVPNYAISERQ